MGALPTSRRMMAVIGCAPLLVAIGCREKIASPLEPVSGPPVNLSSDTRIAFVSTRDGSPYIYLANADGSGLTRLAAGVRPAWSPDGKQIAFHRIGASAIAGLSGLFVMDADGTHVRSLAAGLDPAWSPDGGSIVFDAAGAIYVVHADGTGLTRLLGPDYCPGDASDGCAFSPTWAPDGKHIAFIRATYDDAWQIHVMNADGSDPHPLFFHAVPISSQADPAWSPDGSRILFDSGLDGALAWADTTGRVLFLGPDGACIDCGGRPVWSPDGRQVVFARGLTDKRLRVYDVETGAERQLIANAAAPAPPDYDDYDAALGRVSAPAVSGAVVRGSGASAR